MRPGAQAALAMTTLWLLAGCEEPASQDGREIHADVRGVVLALAPSGPGHGVTLGVVRIEGAKQRDTRFAKASLTVTTATRIYEREAFGQHQVTFADLRLGDKVEVQLAAPTAAPTAPSQPVQATAGEILILLRLGPPAVAAAPAAPPAAPPPAASSVSPAPSELDAMPRRATRPRRAVPPAASSASTGPSVYFPPLPAPAPPPVSTAVAPTPAPALPESRPAKPSASGSAALLHAVRAGPQPAADRAVFEFAGAAVPGHEVTWVDRPVHCGSNLPVPVAGTAWLQVRLHPAQAHDEQGRPTVAPPARPKSLTVIRDLQQVCDAEGVVTWIVGLTGRQEYHVFELAGPPRLVVDVAH